MSIDRSIPDDYPAVVDRVGDIQTPGSGTCKRVQIAKDFLVKRKAR